MNNRELLQLARDLYPGDGIIVVATCNKVNALTLIDFLELKKILVSMGSKLTLLYDTSLL
jgi:hypothetical protein